MTRIGVVAALAATLLGAGSAQRKMQAIENGRLRPGASVLFTPGEINAWANEAARTIAPDGLRNLHVTAATARITVTALMDFLKLRHSVTGEVPGWIGQNLLGGERPVQVTARVESRNGEARVDLERVEISGVPIEGPALDFLIRAYLLPRFPDAGVDEWFRLDWRIARIAVSPRGIAVYIGRN